MFHIVTKNPSKAIITPARRASGGQSDAGEHDRAGRHRDDQ
jgi:hypothetical protein